MIFITYILFNINSHLKILISKRYNLYFFIYLKKGYLQRIEARTFLNIMDKKLDSNKKYLISGSLDNTVKLWNLENNQCVITFEGHTEGVKCVEILNTRQIISGSLDKSLKLWNVNDGKCKKTLKFHLYGIKCLQKLPNNKIASGSFQEILIIDLANNTCTRTLCNDKQWVYSLIVLPNGCLASCSECHSVCPDEGIEIWDTLKGKLINRLGEETESTMELFMCLCLLDENTLVSASTIMQRKIKQEKNITHNIKIWNLDNRKSVKNLTIESGLGEDFNNSRIQSLDIIKELEILIILSRDNTIKMWDLKKDECTYSFTFDQANRIMCVKYYEGDLLLITSSDATIKIFNFKTEECINTLFGHTNTVTDIKIVG